MEREGGKKGRKERRGRNWEGRSKNSWAKKPVKNCDRSERKALSLVTGPRPRLPLRICVTGSLVGVLAARLLLLASWLLFAVRKAKMGGGGGGPRKLMSAVSQTPLHKSGAQTHPQKIRMSRVRPFIFSRVSDYYLSYFPPPPTTPVLKVSSSTSCCVKCCRKVAQPRSPLWAEQCVT